MIPKLTRFLIIILTVFLSCSPLYNKKLYQSEIEIRRTDKSIDTISVVYWDYLLLYDNKLYKKDSIVVAEDIRRYKVLKRNKIK